MSPKKKSVITVKGWPSLKKGKLYKGIVRKAENKTEYVYIEIENLDSTQLGRIHEMDLPLPVRPSRYHKTCSFLIACGIDATTDGISIDLNETVGVTVGMRFSASARDGIQKVDFERIENPSEAEPTTPLEKPGDEQLGYSAFQSEEGERAF